jgi:hypothetical protein
MAANNSGSLDNNNDNGFDLKAKNDTEQQLLELVEYRMPFGKYKGCRLVDLPEPYVVWFAQRGFPRGQLGELLQTVYEIKVNGLEYLFDPLR